MKTQDFNAAVNEINDLWDNEDWDNMNAALMELGEQKLTDKQKAKHLELVSRWEDHSDEEDHGDEEAPSGMASQLNKYKARYQTATGPANSNSASLNNGDALAKLLDGKTPIEVCRLADQFCGKEAGWHEQRYARLNAGQQRMNAGNKLRALVKKGELEVRDNTLVQVEIA